ncbi:MAG: hypothetical protein GQ534_10955 [Candidatus Delongbacteria bacterium]|nr:hypothetical protein [Candidatus Delongbacteria bacterium]
MKFEKIVLLFLLLIFLVSTTSCSGGRNDLDIQLDNLENIIKNYESKFKSVDYGTEEYTKVTQEYNGEISGWSTLFEKGRYEKDENGKRVEKQEFIDVKKRFLELNGRMTRMILSTLPKVEKPTQAELDKNNQENDNK